MKQNIRGICILILGLVAWAFILHIPQIALAFWAGDLVNDWVYGSCIFVFLLIGEALVVPVLLNWGIKSWARFPLIVIGWFILIPASRNVLKLNNNQWGQKETKHADKYIEQGASGTWIPSKLKTDWIDSIWGNPTDGCYGNPKGLWSMIVKGKEYTWFCVYRWLAFHNMTNAFSAMHPFMVCHVPSCKLTVRGSDYLSDRDPVKAGWFFVTAVNVDTRRTYYAFRLVHVWSNGKVLNISFGNKLKPEHRTEEFEPRKERKGFTARVQPMTSTF